jgi:hypothetical protein
VLLRLKGRAQGLVFFILIEIILIGIVSLLFRFFSPPVAGLIAGAGFLLLGISLIVFVSRGQRPLAQASFWASSLYLAVAVIPILMARLLNWGIEFKDITIFGLQGPEFHRLSGSLYVGLLAATVVDWLRALRT